MLGKEDDIFVRNIEEKEMANDGAEKHTEFQLKAHGRNRIQAERKVRASGVMVGVALSEGVYTPTDISNSLSRRSTIIVRWFLHSLKKVGEGRLPRISKATMPSAPQTQRNPGTSKIPLKPRKVGWLERTPVGGMEEREKS